MKLIVKLNDGSVLGECTVVADKNLLDIASDNGIIIPNSCKMGVCSVCLCNIISGAEYLLKKDVMPTEDNMCLACTTYVLPEVIDTDGEIIIQCI